MRRALATIALALCFPARLLAQGTTCPAGTIFDPKIGACLWVELGIQPALACQYTTDVCHAAVPTNTSIGCMQLGPPVAPGCSLRSGAQGSGPLDGPLPCSRLYSRQLTRFMVVQPYGQYEVYDNTDPLRPYVIWSSERLAEAENALRTAFVLQYDGTWRLVVTVGTEAGSTRDLPYSSVSQGVSYIANAGSFNAPFKLLLGDDGIIRLANKYGNIAWMSYEVPPPRRLPPPPAVSPPPPSTPTSTASAPVSCTPGSSVYHSGLGACVWVELDTSSLPFCDVAYSPLRPLCRSAMGPNCALNAFNQSSPCDRIYSPSLSYELVLYGYGNLTLYDSRTSTPIWSTHTSRYSDKFAELTGSTLYVDVDGTWSIVILEWYDVYPSSWYGVSYPENAGPDNGPYKLLVGDDGVLRLVNKYGRPSWASTPQLSPPPSPLAPPSPQAPYPPPPVQCAAASAVFHPELDQCVWVKLISSPLPWVCPDDPNDSPRPPCSANPTMQPSCGLYPSLSSPPCDRIYSPNLRYSLAPANGSLVVYDSLAVPGSDGIVWRAPGDGFYPLDAYFLRTFLTVTNTGTWRLPVQYLSDSLLTTATPTSLEFGTTYPEHAGVANQPYSLQVGDDGVVRLYNRAGRIAWSALHLSPPAPRPPPRPVASPGPAPRPSGYGFPFYNCRRKTEDTPYVPSYSYVNATGQHCFTVAVRECDPAAPCCGMQLYKFMLLAQDESCIGTVYNVTLNGTPGLVFPSWNPREQWDGEFYSTLRLPRLNLNTATAPQATWCFQLAPPCATLDRLCLNGLCRYALADYNGPTSATTCCPVRAFNPGRPWTWDGSR